MRDIALLHYAAPPVIGGVESVIGHHAQLMTRHGHRVRVVAGRGEAPGPSVRFIRIPRADSRHPDVLAVKAELDAGLVTPAFETLVAHLVDELARALQGADLVIAHNVCSLHKNLALTAALRQVCERSAALQLICWHHDLAWTSARYRAELHAGWPWELLRSDWPEARPRHVVISALRQRELSALFGLPTARIRVIPSGLDAAEFLNIGPDTRTLAEQLDLYAADPLLLLPVRITRRKNIELALRVLACLRETEPRAALVVTGPPGPHNPNNASYFDALRALRAELGLSTAVHFLAEVTAALLPDTVIADLYRLADALFFPSREEGFGIPILEAGLVRLPIYCAAIPALQELARDEATYFPPDGAPAEIAAALRADLLQNPTVRLRRRVRREFSWAGVYAAHIAPLIEELS